MQFVPLPKGCLALRHRGWLAYDATWHACCFCRGMRQQNEWLAQRYTKQGLKVVGGAITGRTDRNMSSNTEEQRASGNGSTHLEAGDMADAAQHGRLERSSIMRACKQIDADHVRWLRFRQGAERCQRHMPAPARCLRHRMRLRRNSNCQKCIIRRLIICRASKRAVALIATGNSFDCGRPRST